MTDDMTDDREQATTEREQSQTRLSDAGRDRAQRTQGADKREQRSPGTDGAGKEKELTFRKIIMGDILGTKLVRSQVGILLLIVFFVILYIALRYQCQQDMITIDKLEKELVDAKYKALSSESVLTERLRESRLLDELKSRGDSTLRAAEEPPFIVIVDENE